MEQTIGPSPDNGATARRAAVITPTAMHERVEYHTAADRQCALQLRLQPQLQSVQHSGRQRRDGSTQATHPCSVPAADAEPTSLAVACAPTAQWSLLNLFPGRVPAPTSNGAMTAFRPVADFKMASVETARAVYHLATEYLCVRNKHPLVDDFG